MISAPANELLDTYETFLAAVEPLTQGRHPLPLTVEWITGGITGGSCWGEGGHYSIVADDEPNDETLDAILETVCPNLTFRQYRKLVRAEPYTTETGRHSEYYGNHTDRKSRTLDLYRLYDILKEIAG